MWEPPTGTKSPGRVTCKVIEVTRVPGLLLPQAYEEWLRWCSALVPISGEPSTDESPMLARRLAHGLDLAVTIARVVDRGLP